MSGFKCVCTNCGWTGRRNAKNIGKKPCKKCGGQVTVHEEDKGAVIFLFVGLCVAAVIALIIELNG